MNTDDHNSNFSREASEHLSPRPSISPPIGELGSPSHNSLELLTGKKGASGDQNTSKKSQYGYVAPCGTILANKYLILHHLQTCNARQCAGVVSRLLSTKSETGGSRTPSLDASNLFKSNDQPSPFLPQTSQKHSTRTEAELTSLPASSSRYNAPSVSSWDELVLYQLEHGVPVDQHAYAQEKLLLQAFAVKQEEDYRRFRSSN